MTRISAPQALIFSVSALAVSLVGNGLLYLNINDATTQLTEQNTTIQQLNNELDQQRQLKSTQFERLDAMTGQQSELADIIGLLRTELDLLSQQQQASAETAQLAQQQLAAAQDRISTLDRQLSAAEDDLAQAQITISNQQRALRQQSTPTATGTESTALTTELATQLNPLSAEISVTNAADGTTLVNIPMALIYKNTDLVFAEPAQAILSTLADLLKKHPERQIQVIGHADARPIVSDLAERYPTNWELSSARASRVITFLIEQGLSDHRLLASGRAANQPVRDGASEQDWAVNRRIELQIR